MLTEFGRFGEERRPTSHYDCAHSDTPTDLCCTRYVAHVQCRFNWPSVDGAGVLHASAVHPSGEAVHASGED